MTFLATSIALLLAVSAAEVTPSVVQAPGSPVRVGRAKVFNIVADEPAVLVYAATNVADYDLEEFTIVAYTFDARGTLKARQTAPGRRLLERGTTKFSTMVLDGWPVTATDRIVLGVNQALRAGSEKWWHAELEEAAKAAVKDPQLPEAQWPSSISSLCSAEMRGTGPTCHRGCSASLFQSPPMRALTSSR
jgi:hypothetical protein